MQLMLGQKSMFNSSYPARGRKLFNSLEEVVKKFNSSYPARGRKPRLGRLGLRIRTGSIPLTPQGDGNYERNPITGFSGVQFLLPRKGTETVQPPREGSGVPPRSIPLTPQGDGNRAVHRWTRVAWKVQFLLPRKGTETAWWRLYSIHVSKVQFLLPRKGTETKGNQKAEG